MSNTIDRRKPVLNPFKSRKKGAPAPQAKAAAGQTPDAVWSDAAGAQSHAHGQPTSSHALPQAPAPASGHEAALASHPVPHLTNEKISDSTEVVVPQELLMRFLVLTGEDTDVKRDMSVARFRYSTQKMFIEGEASAGKVFAHLKTAHVLLDRLDHPELAQKVEALADKLWNHPAEIGEGAKKDIEAFKTADTHLANALGAKATAIHSAVQSLGTGPLRSGQERDKLTQALRDAIAIADEPFYYTKMAQVVLDDPSSTLGDKALKLTKLASTLMVAETRPVYAPSIAVIQRTIERLNTAQANTLILKNTSKDAASYAYTLAQKSDPYPALQKRARDILRMQTDVLLSSPATQKAIFKVLENSANPLSDLASLPNGRHLAASLQALSPLDRSILAGAIRARKSVPDAFATLPVFLQPLAGKGSSATVRAEHKAAFNALRAAAAQASTVALTDARQILAQPGARAQLVDRLENRLARLEPPLAARNDNFSRRAFESKLVDILARETPKTTRDAWDHLSDTFIAYTKKNVVTEADRRLLAKDMAKHAERVGVRPWNTHAPDRMLQRGDFAEIEAVLTTPCKTGFDVMAKVQHVRDLWNALIELDEKHNRTGAQSITPRRDETQAFYAKTILQKTGRILNLEKDAQSNAGKQINTQTNIAAGFTNDIGIMANHQPPISPDKTTYNLPGRKYNVVLFDDDLQARVAAGAVTASGISGSMNILLNVYEAFHTQEFAQRVPSRDVLLGAIQFLVYDGGHSLDEVMWTMQNAPNMNHAFPAGDHVPLSYAHFASIYADVPQVYEAMGEALEATEVYAREHGGAKQTTP